jgi:nucleoid-associated protein YgaU
MGQRDGLGDSAKRELTGIAIVRSRPGRAAHQIFRGLAMPRIAHGENVTPDQVEEAERELTGNGGAALAAAAAGPGDRAFGFMFSDLQKDEANLLPQSLDTLEHLTQLGQVMDEPGSGPRGDSHIPAAYTYFGQFVDHDITMEGSPFDPVGLFSPTMVPLSLDEILQLENLRHPTLDLDSVYGPTSPPDQNPPHDQTQPDKMRIGKVTRLRPEERAMGTFRVRLKGDDNDLPRKRPNLNPHQERQDRAALIGDPRNDENLIVAQVHLAFLKAHNTLVDQGKTFGQAQRLLRQHYQHIVIHDFLKRVADTAIVDDILQNGNRVYDPSPGQFFMPLEFTVAAYRFGHSMVRQSYEFNLNFNREAFFPADLFFLFAFTAFSGQLGTDAVGTVSAALEGTRATPTLPDHWIIEWQRFVDTPHAKAANMARQINTKLAEGLFNLNGLNGNPLGGNRGRLAVRNMLRGYRLRIPTGQAVATQLGLQPLTSAEIEVAAGNHRQVRALRAGGFLERTPLWYYLLAEAAHSSGGERLGPVGSTIVAEVLIGLIRRSEDSILNVPGWQPSLPAAHPGRYELADLLRFARVLPRTYKVRRNDVLSTIARDQLRDAGRWPEILILNRDTITHRDVIHEDQVFLLPDSKPMPRDLRPVLHEVQHGDTLKKLAKEFLGNRSRWPEIRDLNTDVLEMPPGGPIDNPPPLAPPMQLVILPP